MKPLAALIGAGQAKSVTDGVKKMTKNVKIIIIKMIITKVTKITDYPAIQFVLKILLIIKQSM